MYTQAQSGCVFLNIIGGRRMSISEPMHQLVSLSLPLSRICMLSCNSTVAGGLSLCRLG